ncbi:hypothetical protein [Meiothermus granaticius]|uniref:DUF1453 domain-containing protein n=1 Tax=Meiothermus granaticius NBRC 107808 TaxID=1227551 RepID=A0A399FE55_9DEIN|nr:hypothetical protein [Meiothermus granaticius]RIH93759.1 hypothetical protein Mgrana_00342 [Meiothermus granaticius NBRC 107808]GEM85718.1 hypothetical protein MGR01S_03430 [Meiothermus granaticius NBRC 107808]
MSTLDLVLNLSLLALMVLTQLGERRLDRWTYLRPALITTGVAFFFLGSLPLQGGNGAMYLLASAAGALFGLLALALMDVRWSGDQGQIVIRAGWGYAAVWIGVIGGRMLFAELATHAWASQVGRFSYEHGITGAEAWRAAFVLMALSMIVARTLGLALRARLLAQSRQALA